MRSILYTVTVCLLLIPVSECAADNPSSVGPITASSAGPTTATSAGPTVPKTSEAPSSETSTEGPKTSPSTNSSTTETPSSNDTSSEVPKTSEAPTTMAPTTMAPTTAPVPAPSKYEYKDNTTVCVIMMASIQVQIEYTKKDNQTATKLLDVPSAEDTTITGTCPDKNDTKAMLGIKFGKEGAERMMTFEFSRDLKTEDVVLMSVTYDIDLDTEDFPDAKEAKLNVTYSVNYGKTTGGRYFKCDAAQTLGDGEVKLITHNLKVQTFGGFVADNFAQTGYECEDDTGKQPDTAPKNKYTFKEDNVTCVVFSGSLTLTLPYMKRKDGGGNESAKATIKVPEQNKITVSGSCGNANSTSQYIELGFYDGWKLKMTFKSDAPASTSLLTAQAGTSYHLDNVDVTYILNNNLFDGVVNPGETVAVNGNISADTFKASSQESYLCSKDQNLNLGNGAQLTTKDMQFQAFMTNENFDNFGSAAECAKDDETNSIVPIAVGAALAGLVIIVLIAYLIGRRRSRSGYEQV